MGCQNSKEPTDSMNHYFKRTPSSKRLTIRNNSKGFIEYTRKKKFFDPNVVSPYANQ